MSWLARRQRYVGAALVIVAAVLRIAYSAGVAATPVGRMHQWRQTDMHYYNQWARAIRGGDWRSEALPFPMHRWHRDVAAQYLADRQDVKTVIGTGGDIDAALWARWTHAPRFYQDPLYAYLLAGAYLLTPNGVRALLVLQLALGVLTVALVWALARRFFGNTVGTVAGCLAVLCGPLLFYEQLLLRDSFIAFAGLMIVWVFEESRGHGFGWGCLVGVTIGIAALLKSTFIAFAFTLIGWLLVSARRGERGPLRQVAGLCVGCFVAVAPLVARNIAVGVPPVALASSGPLTFVAANASTANPDVGFGIDARALATFLGSTDGGWRAAIGTALDGQPVSQIVARGWRKWDRLWHWFEIPNNENFYYARTQVPLLAALPLTFAVISPLALVGLVLTAPRWRRHASLLLLLGTTAATW